MSIKLAVLKSGEDIIADVKELIVEENIVGYLFDIYYSEMTPVLRGYLLRLEVVRTNN